MITHAITKPIRAALRPVIGGRSYVSLPKVEMNVFLVAGQSNTDGRVAYNDVNAPGYLSDKIVDGVKVWNGSTVVDYHISDIGPSGTGAGWVQDNALDKFSFVQVALHGIAASLDDVVACQVTEGGTAIDLGSNTRGSWNADYSLIPEGTPALLQALENRFIALKAYCSANGIALNVRGVLWHQGESDGDKGRTQAEHYAGFSAVVSTMREFTEISNLPIYFGTVSDSGDKTYPEIRAALEQFAANDANAYCRDNSDLTNFDGVHFDAVSCITFGEWVANTALTVEGITPAPEPEPEPDSVFADIISSYYANDESGLVTNTKDFTTLHQNSDGTVPVTAGDPVGYVSNLLNTGINLTQSIAGSRPIAQSSGLMLFDGQDDYLDTGVTQIGNTRLFADASDQFYIAIPFRISKDALGTLIGKAGSSGGSRQFFLYFYGASTHTQTPAINVRGALTATDWDIDDDLTHVIWVNWDGVTMTMGYDSQPSLVISVGTAPEETDQRILIGSRGNGVNNPPMTGQIGVPLIRDVSLSEADRTSVALNLLSHVTA